MREDNVKLLDTVADISNVAQQLDIIFFDIIVQQLDLALGVGGWTAAQGEFLCASTVKQLFPLAPLLWL